MMVVIHFMKLNTALGVAQNYKLMPLGIIIVAILLMITLGFFNIRSLVRKWKHNPGSWFDLLVGIVITLVAIGLLTFFLFKNHI